MTKKKQKKKSKGVYPNEAVMAGMKVSATIRWPWASACPTLHFCQDHDGMLIHDRMKEFESCSCFKQTAKSFMGD